MYLARIRRELGHGALGDLQTPGDLDLAERFGMTEFVQTQLLFETGSRPLHASVAPGRPVIFSRSSDHWTLPRR